MSRPHSNESVYRALAHPTRRAVIESLRLGERPVNDMLPKRGISLSSLSEHLRVLRMTGLISFRRRGPALVYRLNPKAMIPVMKWLEFVGPRL